MTHLTSRFILKSGRIFDSITGKIKENFTIVIEGNKIIWIGEDSSFEKERNDEIIELSNKTVLPGLIDCHVHLEATSNPQYEREYLRTTDGMFGYIALYNAQKHLSSGFTCIRDCGGDPFWSASLRRIFDSEILAGPRLLVATKGIAQWGNQEAIGPQPFIDYRRHFSEVQTGVDGIRHAVRERKFLGADFIKTITTGGVLHGMKSSVGTSLFLEEELIAMANESHRLGMHVACHAHGVEGIRKAVDCGIDTIEHGSFVDEDTMNLMIEKGCFLIPTQTAGMGLNKPEIMNQMPPEVKDKTKEVLQSMLSNHKLAYEKGVKIGLGTDAGTPGNPHGNTAQEIENMINNVGMTPAQALQTATIESAKAIRIQDEIGSIEIGKFADIIVCDKDPSEDIKILQNRQNILYVIKNGKIMAKKGLISYFK